MKVITSKDSPLENQFDISKDDNSIFISTSGKEVGSVGREFIKSKTRKILVGIKNLPDDTTIMVVAQEILQKLHLSTIKASHTKKSDISLVIHDRVTGTTPEVGFSIKSMLGGASTLLNVSGATEIKYKIIGNIINAESVNSIDSRSKYRDRIKHIYEHGAELEFVRLTNHIFESNLRKVDSLMPYILAESVKMYFQGIASKITENVLHLEAINPLKGYFNPPADFYEFKMKNLLLYSALGMMPATNWDGLLEAHGGYIIVKEDGELACFHIYNLDNFRQYLYLNTSYDTPSSRWNFGNIYEEEGQQYINLNFQIRFN